MVKVLSLTNPARAGRDNVSFMGSFRASVSGVALDRRSDKVHAWVGTIRVDVVASGVFAHDGYGVMEGIEGRRL